MIDFPQKTSIRELFNISRLAIRYSWLTLSFWLAVCVAGILAFSSLKYALFPDITFPVVVVNATANFPTAQETETKLTLPIEQRLGTLTKLDDIRSSTYPGQTAISLSFQVGTSLEDKESEVKTVLGQLTLPEGGSFKVIPFNLNESAVASYAIESPGKSLAQLTEITQQQIEPKIAQLPGVLKVELVGTPSTSVEQNKKVGKLSTDTETEKEKDAKNSSTLPPQALKAGSLVRFNGKDALALQVIKRGDANTLEVVSQVEKVVAQLHSTLPSVQLTLARTPRDYIQEATQATIETLAVAVALSVLVIFTFLWNWQATLISALAIPTSLLGTFIVMATCGFNLETITLLALALVIGIIVDDAIVDVENIVRHLEQGKHPRQAALAATNEIGLTVTATTFTIVAVFLPVGLMGGVVGQFFKPFGITVSAAVITSLLVARTLSPLLAVYWLKPKKYHREQPFWLTFVRGYRNLLRWSISHRSIVLILAVLFFAVGLGLLPYVPQGFIPQLDRGEFLILYKAPATTSLNESGAVAEKLEGFLLRVPEVETVFTTVGSREGEISRGTLYVKLHSDRTMKTAELEDQFRHQLPSIPNVTTSVADIPFVETTNERPLQVTLLGDDLAALNRAAKAIKERIEKLPGFADVTVNGETEVEGTFIEIQHFNSRRVAYISANLSNNLALGNATKQLLDVTKEILPASISLNLGGDSARAGEIFRSFSVTLGLSVLCILLVLILLFRGWVAPLAIIFSLPLSLTGAVVALLVSHNNFGIISAIGIIFLLGLTNKNAILLVDYIIQLRRSGLTRTDAILNAAPVRLRPILMTTAAMILGMLPVALGLGAGSELRSPMAVAIIGGLVASTLLSLIVVPVVYTLLDDCQYRKKF